jgi:hypothetical protein
MKVICIDTIIPGRLDEKYIHITIDKIYDTIDFSKSDQMVEIVDDSGKKCWYLKKQFKLLSEFRGDKLDKLGI